MKNFDVYSMTGRTEEDSRKILEYIEKELDLFIDDVDRVWNNNGEHIADAIRTEPGNGIGC